MMATLHFHLLLSQRRHSGEHVRIAGDQTYATLNVSRGVNRKRRRVPVVVAYLTDSTMMNVNHSTEHDEMDTSRLLVQHIVVKDVMHHC